MCSDASVWDKVCQFMEAESGVHLGQSQAYLLAARLEPVAKEMAFSSVAEFVAAVCATGSPGSLRNALIEAMTTHETSFFRDTSFWMSMEKLVLPVLEQLSAPKVRIISTACSHGQEVYSLVMLISEKFPGLFGRLEITATDIAEASLVRARAGVFSSFEVNRGLNAVRVLKFFEKSTGGFKVKEEFRKKIRFVPHNLLMPLELVGGYSLVLCRNVLIYFDEKNRTKVLGHLLKGVSKDGFIGLGSGELYLGSPLPGGLYENSKIKGWPR